MRVLITGAAGFIGSHLADRLLADGNQVFGIDNLTTGLRENVAAEVDFYEQDIEALANFARVSEPDIIIHCAASYDNRDLWHRDTDTNVKGAINVAIAARAADCPVVYFQTALCYGNRAFDVSISTTQHLAPDSSYAISKVAAEQYLRLSGVPLTVFRLANIYGPRNLSGPVPTFYKRLTEGESVTVVDSRRDFVYIDDLVNLVVQAISNRTTGTFHVSTGSDYAIKDVLINVADALDMLPIDFEETARGDDDAPTILLDPSLTKEKFGWEATTELDEGILAAVEYYREVGVEQVYTHLKLKG